MPQQTPNLNLVLFDDIDDKPESFLAYRTAIAGTESTSNMNIIDDAIQQNVDDINTIKGIGWTDESIRGNALEIVGLKSNDVYTVQMSGTNSLTGNISEISMIPNDSILKIIPNAKNTTTVTVSINGETAIPLVKVRNISGSTVYAPLEAGDLQPNMPIFITKSPTGARYIAVGFGEQYARNLFYDNGDGTFTSIQTKISDHLDAEMPHILYNANDGKYYKYGEQISAEGKPQLIFEEVI
jgi:hypothetical protein